MKEMNGFWRKSIVAAVLMGVLSACVFAEKFGDRQIAIGQQWDTPIARDEFLAVVMDDNIEPEMQAVVDEMYIAPQGGTLDKFFVIRDNEMEDEDVQAVNAVKSYIAKSFRISKGASFMTMVTRGETDGWFVWSNYVNKNDSVHAVFYFSYH